MRPRRLVAAHDATDIFDRAVREHALAVLTIQDDQQWHTFKSRFLERDPKGRFFVLDHQAVGDQALPSVSPGQCLGVSFRQKSRKLLFATVVEAKGHFVLDNNESVAAVRCRWPDSMTELQRRAYHRTPVPGDMTFVASLWEGGAQARAAAQGQPLAVLSGNLADLSCGGALVLVHTLKPPPWSDEQTLGMELQLPDGRAPITVDVRYRGTRAEVGGELSVAIQFVGLELSPDGQVVLQRLANSVQRLHRKGLSSNRDNRDSKYGF